MTERIVIVGGSSRAARAIRHRLGEAVCLSVVRSGSADGGAEVVVADYRQVPASLDMSDAVIINCVGSPTGPRDRLLSVNRDVPKAWAEAGRERGATGFIQLSSFSVYEIGGTIGPATPLRPSSEYGRSKLAAETSLAALQSDSFSVDLLRIPILVGAGGDKLARLVQLVRQTKAVPRPPHPVPRPMLSYSALAAVVADLVARPRRQVSVAADPVPFDYPMLQEQARALGLRATGVPVPALALALLRRSLPALYRSMFMPMLVSPEVNIASAALPFETLPQVITRLLIGQS